MSSPENHSAPDEPARQETGHSPTVSSGPGRLRSKFRFGIRTLLVAMAVGGATARYAIGPQLDRKRNESIERVVKSHGGSTGYNPRNFNKHWFHRFNPLATRYSETEYVRFVRGNINDAELKHLAEGVLSKAHELSELDLDGNPVTDEGVEALLQLSSLRGLDLNETNISDETIAIILQMPNLERLSIAGTAVTDEGIRELVEAKCLKKLVIMDMPVMTDEALRHIASHPTLERLTVGGPGVTDNGLRYLEQANNLKLIIITRCKVTPRGLDRLWEANKDTGCHVFAFGDIAWQEPKQQYKAR